MLFGAGLFSSVSAQNYSGGTGEPSNPYQISTPSDMNDIGNHPEDYNKCFIMMNDINLADYTGTQFNIIGTDSNAFTGVFDGNGHKISKFSYDSSGASNIGVFGMVIGENAEIKNLGLIEPNITGTGNFVGPVAGHIWDGVALHNCYANGGQVIGFGVIGGLVGHTHTSSVTNSYSTTRVSAHDRAGGLVGAALYSSITNSYATGDVSGTDFMIGSLVGENEYDSTITNCFAAGAVDGNNFIGGLVGINGENGTIENCYSAGQVSGNYEVGGLLGRNGESAISNCYTSGSVDGNDAIGGLVGYDNGDCFYSKCFWDSDISPDVNGIGNINDPNVIGQSTANMKKQNTFNDSNNGDDDDWDFVRLGIWSIGENQTYPYLRVYSLGDINHDKVVNFIDVAILADHWLECNLYPPEACWE